MRGRRQLVSGQTTGLLDDIIVRQPSHENPASILNAPLANPDRLWPSGEVEYVFYRTFPDGKKKLVIDAMEYITRKVPCITFKPKNVHTIDYVAIYDGSDCSSEIGRVGGRQTLTLNR